MLRFINGQGHDPPCLADSPEIDLIRVDGRMLDQDLDSINQDFSALGEFIAEFAGRLTTAKFIPGKDRVVVAQEDLHQWRKWNGTVPSCAAASMNQDDGWMRAFALRHTQIANQPEFT